MDDLARVKAKFRQVAEGRLARLGNPEQRKKMVELGLKFLDTLMAAEPAWAQANLILMSLADAVAQGDLGCCTYRVDGTEFSITATEAECNMIPADLRVGFDPSGPCA
jgi:hypothetical protein